ncbi:sensor histidine kinase [Gymnodinialimonas sp. 2305UL16-5]|uniref:sensor histidine kinase n=1 Tax=Gymnodinialimonas mytili TaxID=3126503 RepID=UPI0030A4BA03
MKRRRPWQGLTPLWMRLALLLSIGVLPLGVVAVVQTAAVVAEAERLERSYILSRTLRAVGAERALLRRAYGSAEALGATAWSVGSGTAACENAMASFTAANDSIVFAGFIDTDGVMRCSSARAEVDFAGQREWESFIADPRPMVNYNANGAASGQAVLVVSVPIYDPDTGILVGASSASLPGALISTLINEEFDGIRLALLDADGRVLAASSEVEEIEHLDLVPSALTITDGGHTRDVRLLDGQFAQVVLVPLIEDRVYVVGVWDGGNQAFAVNLFGTTAPLFPILMWLIALGVGIFAIDRLVLRHLNLLRDRMSGFSVDQPDDSFAMLKEAPPEIAEIAETYNRMVDRILGDRADLAEALDEKELLLREVHHRVKNNLQMIASMINIQIRSVPEGNARRILKRMQDRVMGLSSIHKALYAGNTLARVRADNLLRDVLQNTLNIGLPAGMQVTTDMDFDPIELDPDQAVPLTLLASELTTNAVKYVGRHEDGTAFIRIAFKRVDDDLVLQLENSIGTPVQDQHALDGTGLGAHLIEAFVSQLNAEIEIDSGQTLYRVRVMCSDLILTADEDENQDDLEDEDDDDTNVALPRAS